jgi:hypothetical protein
VPLLPEAKQKPYDVPPGHACPPERLSRRGPLALGLRPEGDSTMTDTRRRTSAHAPLPNGWKAFSSEPDGNNAAHWYATSPYPVNALKAQHGKEAYELYPTVAAVTWPELHAEVVAQVEMYQRLTGEVDE